jgi:hypothetical protein
MRDFRTLFGFLALLALPHIAQAVNVSGLQNNEIWTKANSPYRVTGAINVMTGTALTIQAGVEILFDADVEIVIQGRLSAVGTPTDSIVFAKGTAASWKGFRFSGGDSSTLAWVRISNGFARDARTDGGALSIEGTGTRITMANCVISKNAATTGGGIRANSGTVVSIVNSTITGNSVSGSNAAGGGIYNSSAKIDVANSTISANTASGSGSDGGGIYNNAGTTTLTNCKLTGNTAQSSGGGAYNNNGTLTFASCTISRNTTTAGDGGGVYNYQGTTNLTNCVIVGNKASGRGAGVLVYYYGPAPMTNCTFYGNTAGTAGAVYSYYSTAFTVKNIIAWGNGPSPVQGVSATYSNIEQATGIYTGVGNFNLNPLFVDSAGGDFRLQPSSPCINMGDPTSPKDADGTNADIGANLGPEQGTGTSLLWLSTVIGQPGGLSEVTVMGRFYSARSLQAAFLINEALIETVYVARHAFGASENAMAAAHTYGDAVTVYNGEVISLRVKFRDDAPPAVYPLRWVGHPFTLIDETAADALVDDRIELNEGAYYGDVTDDGALTSFDASTILQYLVRRVFEIRFERADVSNNGAVTAYDAALILHKLINPLYMFPVQGGGFPKLASATPRMLAFEPTDAGWAFAANDASGIMAGDFIFVLGNDSPVALAGDGMFAYRQEGRTLYVSFVRTGGDGNALFSLVTASAAAPEIARISLNEGAIPTLAPEPTPFSLSQNAPNPFNPGTTIRFTLPEAGQVRLAVYDITGSLVRVLTDGTTRAGTHEAVWDGLDMDGRACASGLYVYRLAGAQGSVTRRMTLSR